MPDLEPVPLAEVLDADIRDRFEHHKNTRGFTPNSIMTMVRRPEIVRTFMALHQGGTVRRHGADRDEDAGQSGQQLCTRLPLLPVAHGEPVEHLSGVGREDRRALGLRTQRLVQRLPNALRSHWH